MPLEKLSCPDCGTALKPGKPIAEGKKVKCSKCGSIFVAGGSAKGAGDGKKRAASPSDKIAATPGKGASASTPTKAGTGETKQGDDDDGGGGTYGFAAGDEPVLKPPEPPLVKKKKRLSDEDDDEDEDDNDEDDEDEEEKLDPVLEMYLKVDKSTNPRGPATALITGPSNLLIITHGLLALLQVVAFTFWVFPMLFGEHCNITPKDLKGESGFEKKEYKVVMEKTWDDIEADLVNSKTREKDKEFEEKAMDHLKEMESDKRKERWIQMIFPPLLLAYCGLIVYGAVQMQSLESYPWAWTSVIMALIPAGSAGAAWIGVYWLMRLLGPVEFLDLGWGNVPYYVIFGFITAWAIFVAVYALMRMLEPIVKDAFFYVEE